MAIECKLEKNFFGEKIIFEKAYHIISSVSGNKNMIEAYVTSYKDMRKNEILMVRKFDFIPSEKEDSARWDKQAYEHIKKLKEFSGYVDVL